MILMCTQKGHGKVQLVCLIFHFNSFIDNGDRSSLGHHDLDELLVVDLAVAVNIGLTDHLVDLLVSQLLAEVGHDMAELSSRDETILVLVEDAKGLLKLLLGVGVLHLPCHQVQELWEVNGPIAISINLVDHVLQLCFSGVLAKGAHHSSKLLGSDAACSG
jgi:hypothetical protein|uniref:Uncharacterized protein n=1 Tax=Zea mays TaxID=4577 RepID=C4IY49_MAIZE|nr:unknown [Zea mays]